MRELQGILKEIIEYKLYEVKRQKEIVALAKLQRKAEEKICSGSVKQQAKYIKDWEENTNIEKQPTSVDESISDAQSAGKSFYQALRKPGEVAIIAEVKRKSPSKGLLRADFNPEEIINSYTEAGASALSILTDEKFFGGSPEYLKLAAEITPLPLLRKDFIIDEYQIYEAVVLGASAVLLIARVLQPETLKRFYTLVGQLGLDALVEVHGENELALVLEAGVKIVGINNRNLETFQTDINHTLRLREKITAPDVVVVSESGIKTYADILTLKSAEVDAVLVGESFMVRPDVGAGVRELRGDTSV